MLDLQRQLVTCYRCGNHHARYTSLVTNLISKDISMDQTKDMHSNLQFYICSKRCASICSLCKNQGLPLLYKCARHLCQNVICLGCSYRTRTRNQLVGVDLDQNDEDIYCSPCEKSIVLERSAIAKNVLANLIHWDVTGIIDEYLNWFS